jgi:hypothetical protein
MVVRPIISRSIITALLELHSKFSLLYWHDAWSGVDSVS